MGRENTRLHFSSQKLEGFNKNEPIIVRDKVVGRSKHYTPANKEWKDSIYSFTPNYLKSVVSKHSLANKLVKVQLSLHGLKNIARSRRMRMKKIRFSTRKLIISNPEIKHTSDKVNITVYVFNREKQYYVRKLFFYKRKQRLYNSWITTRANSVFSPMSLGVNTRRINTKLANLTGKRKSLFKLNLNKFKKRNTKRHIPYYGMKLRNERDFLRYKLSGLSRKLRLLDKFYTHSFINYLKSLLTSNSSLKGQEMPVNSNTSTLVLNNQISFKGLQSIITNIVKTGVISYSEVTYLYTMFIKEKYRKIRSILLKRGSKILHLQAKLQVNQLKSSRLVSWLKTLMSKLYEKKTELNIVNLKYLHLNSDIYTQAIALKLRKKNNLLKVMKKSFALVKLPKAFLFRKEKFSLNQYVNLNAHKNLHTDKLHINVDQKVETTTKDRLNLSFEKLFPYSLVNGSLKKRDIILPPSGIDKKVSKLETSLPIGGVKTKQVLDNVKFKWVSGLRLEIAGRLTRRYKAARAAFKFKYKGNLKSKQYYMELGVLRVMPTIMLRNNNKVNTQFSFIKSKRRIGSFGIKSWISQY